MDIIGKMHDFDFVAFIQRQPELVFAEQRFCLHCLFAFVADCLYGLHVCYGTLAVQATQAKPTCRDCRKAERPAWAIGGLVPMPDIVPSKPLTRIIALGLGNGSVFTRSLEAGRNSGVLDFL